MILIDLELKLPIVEKPTLKPESSESKGSFDDRFLQIQAQEKDLERLQICSNAWNALQSDLQELQQLYVDFNKIVHVS